MSLLYSGHTLTRCSFSTCACCWVSHFSHCFSFTILWVARGTLRKGKRKGPSSQCQLWFVHYLLKHSPSVLQLLNTSVLEKLRFYVLLNAHERAPVRCNCLKGSQWEGIWLNFLKAHTRDISDAKATAATKCKLLFLRVSKNISKKPIKIHGDTIF